MSTRRSSQARRRAALAGRRLEGQGPARAVRAGSAESRRASGAAGRPWRAGRPPHLGAQHPAHASTARRRRHRRRRARRCEGTVGARVVPFTRGTYALDPDGTAEQRTPTRGVPLLYVRESALGWRDRRPGRAPDRLDLHRQLHVSVRQRHRQSPRPRSEAARRIRALQRASGSRRRTLHRRWRQHLERRRRQRHDVGRAAGDWPRDGGVAGPAIGAVHLAWIGRARADGFAVVREASDRAAEVDRRRASTAT